MNTNEVVEKIKNDFKESILNEIEFHSQITLQIKVSVLIEMLTKFKNEYGYDVLMDLTAVDYIHPDLHTKIIYWLHNSKNFERIRLTVLLNREEPLPSVVELWEGADWYERELYDLFGVLIKGHPNLTRILMPDDWIGHPLRRDYPLTEEPVEFKHGVKPKVPSQIIPYVKERKIHST